MGRVAERILMAALVTLLAALAWVVASSPPEQVMGERIRILYVHVGSAWTAYLSYGITAFCAAAYLRLRTARWDRWAVSSAELGFVLTSLTLVTGSLWGQATQQRWWWWDARLTITLLLWFLYAGYLILRQYTDGETRARLSAVLALTGVAATLLNHVAVSLWKSFHPQPILARPGGPAVQDPMYLLGIGLSLAAYTVLYVLLLAHRASLESQREVLAALRYRDSGNR